MQDLTLKNRILQFVTALMCGLALVWPVQAGAAPGDYTIQFEADPLFRVTAWAPGETVTRFIRFTNNMSITRQVAMRVSSFSDPDLLAGQVDMVIKKGSTQLWSGTLRQLYSAGELPVEALASRATSQYDIKATFNYFSDDRFQGKSAYFDLDIGFIACTSNTCTPSSPVTTSTGGGGSVLVPALSGNLNFGTSTSNPNTGSTSGETTTDTRLEIYEGTISVNAFDSGTAIVSWKTNLPSNGVTVYAVAENGQQISFDPTSTSGRMGYTYSQTGTSGQVYHQVYIYGLDPGQKYFFRVANSLDSQLATSFEHSFETPVLGERFIPQEYQAGRVESINNPHVKSASDRQGYVGDSGASIGVPGANPTGEAPTTANESVSPNSTDTPYQASKKTDEQQTPESAKEKRFLGFTPQGGGLAAGSLGSLVLIYLLHKFFVHGKRN